MDPERSDRNRPLLLLFCSGALLLAGCGTVRETLPARSALEQLVISTAADRAVARVPDWKLSGDKVFLDTTNLDCYDKPYVVQRIRELLLGSRCTLVDTRQEAQIVLQPASGGLSMNKRDYLLGIPSIPIPVPFADGVLETPEVPIFKAVHYLGRAKLLFSALDAETNSQAVEIPVCYGKSRDSYYWVLIFGPIPDGDLPKGTR